MERDTGLPFQINLNKPLLLGSESQNREAEVEMPGEMWEGVWTEHPEERQGDAFQWTYTNCCVLFWNVSIILISSLVSIMRQLIDSMKKMPPRLTPCIPSVDGDLRGSFHHSEPSVQLSGRVNGSLRYLFFICFLAPPMRLSLAMTHYAKTPQ